MEAISNNFGHRLRRLLATKGETHGEFAARYGITESQLYNWFKRQEPPLPKHWDRLAKHFGVTREEIAFGAKVISDTPLSAVHEKQAPYGDPTPPSAATLSPPTSPRRPVELAPTYRLPAETPSEKQCLEYMAAYLAAGRQVPGAAAATWLELQEKFPLARWQKFTEAHQ